MDAVITMSRFDSPVDGLVAPRCSVQGGARSCLFNPIGFSLWQASVELEAGAEMIWDGSQGDEGVYVVEGCIELDGKPCQTGGAFVVESGVSAVARSVSSVRLIHCGATDPHPPTDGPFGAPSAEGHRTHLIPTPAVAAQFRAIERPVTNSFFSDGSCPTCRIALFLVDGRESTDGYVGSSHLHSHDEVIHVLDGELRFGALRVGSGQSVAIPANRRYGFRTPAGFRFLNFRRDAATATFAPGSIPILETFEALTTAGVARPI